LEDVELAVRQLAAQDLGVLVDAADPAWFS
jgi:hypothetical protein